MMIRKSTISDMKTIMAIVAEKQIAYITPELVKADIENSRQFVMIENGEPIAIISVVYDNDFSYYAMKRLCVLNPNYHGVAYKMIGYITECMKGEKIGCTPWDDNYTMKHILNKLGFALEYKFAEKWCFYSKIA